MCFQKSKIKITIIYFHDRKGDIHNEFVSQGHTVTGKYYLNTQRLRSWIVQIMFEYRVQDVGFCYMIMHLFTSVLLYVNFYLKTKQWNKLVMLFTRFISMWLFFVNKIKNSIKEDTFCETSKLSKLRDTSFRE